MSAHERKTWDIARTASRLISRSAGACEVCHDAPGNQIAHRIPQTKGNIKKYGVRIIHHPENLKWVCSLACNSKVNIGNKPVPVSELVKTIEEELNAE